VVGYKPTYGKISLGGAKSLSPSLDTLGVFSRTVEDAALCVAVMSGDTELAKIETLSKKPRIATCLTYDAHLASADTVAAIAHAALLAEDLFKTTVPEIKLPALFKKNVRTARQNHVVRECSQFFFLSRPIMQNS